MPLFIAFGVDDGELREFERAEGGRLGEIMSREATGSRSCATCQAKFMDSGRFRVRAHSSKPRTAG